VNLIHFTQKRLKFFTLKFMGHSPRHKSRQTADTNPTSDGRDKVGWDA
jgi:hypothetical protein